MIDCAVNRRQPNCGAGENRSRIAQTTIWHRQSRCHQKCSISLGFAERTLQHFQCPQRALRNALPIFGAMLEHNAKKCERFSHDIMLLLFNLEQDSDLGRLGLNRPCSRDEEDICP
ncbi:hypothetical protein RHECNPAF_4300119 [Rhizobium etli CNPAF512]|nr:hypothetical protein RHECNPAF_4300119 [Rhizobium etli CNPAF512]